MPNTKPVTDLTNYSAVLKEVSVGNPVYLTENVRLRYVIVDFEEYERTQAVLKLISKITQGDRSGDEKGWIDIANVSDMLRKKNIE